MTDTMAMDAIESALPALESQDESMEARMRTEDGI